MSKAKADTLEAMRARLAEMRKTMEQFESDMNAAGLDGLSFERWRDVLDRNDSKLAADAKRERDADQT